VWSSFFGHMQLVLQSFSIFSSSIFHDHALLTSKSHYSYVNTLRTGHGDFRFYISPIEDGGF